ncbi:hypothetical protein CN957_12930 [Bacillus cereus]|nr:hypothetical protein CN957_12930 [Bacillus cereus]
MKIRIARLDQGQQELKVVEVEHEISVLQEIVDGNLDCVNITPEIDLWCNGDHLNRDDLEWTALFVQRGRVFGGARGNIYFASYDGEGTTTSISDEQIKELKAKMNMAIMTNGDSLLAIHVD